MHKIVLIEDRRSRMEIYLENGESDVDKLSKLEYLDLYGPDDAKNNISKSDYSFLQKYQLIIAHRSALLETSNTSAINELYEYCKSNKKDLILFSGGIAQSSYFEDGFNVLLINSKVFYHQRLFAFLDDYSNEENEIKLIELKNRLLTSLNITKNPNNKILKKKIDVDLSGYSIDINTLV